MNSGPKIIVIGAGVIGLAIARELNERGLGDVTVLDKGEAGREASWAAAGILAPQAETDRRDEFFDLCLASNRMYPEFASGLLEETGIDVELDRTGTIYVAFTESDQEELEKRFAWQFAAGLDVTRLEKADVCELEPAVSQAVRMGLLFTGDHQVENRRLVESLVGSAQRRGISILKGTEAVGIRIENGSATAVETPSGPLTAETIVIATGAWSSLIQIGSSPSGLPVRPIRGQMLMFQPDGLMLRHVIYSRHGYLVPRVGGRILAGATVEDVGFDREITATATKKLTAMAAEIVPLLGGIEPAETWTGLRPLAPDGMPVIGPFAGISGLFSATGHYRNGILLAPITAQIIGDAIEGRIDPRYLPFGPDRFLLSAH